MTAGRGNIFGRGQGVIGSAAGKDILRLAVFVAAVLGCRAAVGTSVEAGILEDIRGQTEALGYSEIVSQQLADIVAGWKDSRGQPIVQTWTQRLASKTDPAELASIQRETAVELCRKIRDQFQSGDCFDLAEVVRQRRAQCLGYSQLFYILGGAAGLSVRAINVTEMSSGPLPTGAGHVCCLVDLADGSTITADVAENSVSKPFVMNSTFTLRGNYLSLLNRDNPSGLFGEFELLDVEGLAAQVWASRGKMWALLGLSAQAASRYSRAIELNPYSAEAHNNRAIAYNSLGLKEQALADYDTAIGLRPRYAEAWNNRGTAWAKSGELELAIVDYTTAIELKPDFAAAYNNRANAHARLRSFDKAIADYSHAIKLDSTLAQAYGNRAVSYVASGRADEARRDLLRAVTLDEGLKAYAARVSERFDLKLRLD